MSTLREIAIEEREIVMPRTIKLIATGMVTFTPGSVPYPNTVDTVTFIMMDNPSRRPSDHNPNETIVKHSAFLLALQKNIVSSSSYRPQDLPENRFQYGGWILDKERLSLKADAQSKVTFDSSISEIADLRALYPQGLLDPRYATISPPKPEPVAAQFVVQSGKIASNGKASRVEFRVPTDPTQPSFIIRNEVQIHIETNDELFTISSVALGTGTALTSMRFKFAENQEIMPIYFGSAPPAALLEIPDGQKAVTHSQDVDFELFYDITLNGPPARRPILIHVPGGPVPGSERCPPLQNR